MVDPKRLGFYKEFRGEKFPSLKEVVALDEREEELDSKILDYLKNGILLMSLRTWFTCPVFDEKMSGPSVYIDGEWFWTTEYIFYIQKFQVEIPEAFISKMTHLKFTVPTGEELGGKEILMSLEKEIIQYLY